METFLGASPGVSLELGDSLEVPGDSLGDSLEDFLGDFLQDSLVLEGQVVEEDSQGQLLQVFVSLLTAKLEGCVYLTAINLEKSEAWPVVVD